MKKPNSNELLDACPLGKEYTSGPMQKGSSFTEGLRRLAIAVKVKIFVKMFMCSFVHEMFTFDYCHDEDVKDQRHKQIHFHFIQVFVIKQICEGNEACKPYDSMT
jgi:hypothetical protein